MSDNLKQSRAKQVLLLVNMEGMVILLSIVQVQLDKVIRCVGGWWVVRIGIRKIKYSHCTGFSVFLSAWDSVLTSLQNVPMSKNGAVGSDIEEKLSNLSVEKASYPSEMFRKERASFKLNKSSKGKTFDEHR